MPRTRDEQIAALQKTASGRLLPLAKPALMLVTAGFLITGAVTRNPVFYAVALAAGLLTLAVWWTTHHLLNAARGLTEGIRQNGMVDISLRMDSDGERKYEIFQGIISMNNVPLWKMDFIQPQQWEPTPGLHSAQLAFIRGIEWPVILILDNGVLCPSRKPERALKSQIIT